MRLVKSKLKREEILKNSGFFNGLYGCIPSLKVDKYRIIKETSVGGDAPKELLRVYEFENGKKRIHNPHNWSIYIAKTGHKWYPYESITEYILNKIGECLGLCIAESKLYMVNGQVRFLSKLFRNEKNQVLEHGAELYSGYLGDKEFVEQIEENRMARDFFTIKFTLETLKHSYPYQYETIFNDFITMLVFDAVIGNNDRHFYNWGVIKHLNDKHQPYFSPIYDTARALFWNRREDDIQKLHKNHYQRNKLLENYVTKSKPKIGLENKSNASHLDIIKALCSKRYGNTKEIVNDLINDEKIQACNDLLNGELRPLLSLERLSLITECLNLRYKYLKKAINQC